MFRTIINFAKSVLNIYPNMLTAREYKLQKFEKFNERPVEYGFVFKALATIYPKSILDVGTGLTALPHLMRNCGFVVTASDNIVDYWPQGMNNRHYHVINDDITQTRIQQKFDLITCISTLEHIVPFDDAVANMFALLNTGGLLIITCPYTENGFIDNVYILPESTYPKDKAYGAHSFSKAEVANWCTKNNAEVVEQEYWQFWTGHCWTVGSPIVPPVRSDAERPHQISCILLKKN
jgi:2-polyprenyl-3-methyl-5-hydroxy-6-metoxy-1,4-benzoquinol methylase